SLLDKRWGCREILYDKSTNGDTYITGLLAMSKATNKKIVKADVWGCREILYDKSTNGDTYVTGLAMSKATNKKIVKADVYAAACCPWNQKITSFTVEGFYTAESQLAALEKTAQ
ncbi:Zeta-carotene desaturase, chloroplastic/chromoplastic, partial [Thalictrum thalictroides]